MKLRYFTKEQIEELSEVFNIKSVENLEPRFKVRDGYVGIHDMVWWLSDSGPSYDEVSIQVENIKLFPELYSIEKPTYTAVYIYD